MGYKILPRGRSRFYSRYRWTIGQSTLPPLQIESVISGLSKSQRTNGTKSEKCDNKVNESTENKRISNPSLISSSSSYTSSTTTTSTMQPVGRSEGLPQSER